MWASGAGGQVPVNALKRNEIRPRRHPTVQKYPGVKCVLTQYLVVPP
jgi:hypothetical protein